MYQVKKVKKVSIEAEHTYLLDDLAILEEGIQSCIDWIQEMTNIVMDESGEVPEEFRRIRSNLVMAAIEVRRVKDSEEI